MSKIRITTDSASDLPRELLEKFNITINPTYLCFDEEVIPDTEIDRRRIFDYYNEKKVLVKSSASNVEDYKRMFESITSQGFEVVHIGMSSGISCSVQNAKMAAEDLDGVYVVDSLQLSSGLGAMAIEAAVQAENMTAPELVNHLIKYRDKINTSFVLDSLDYLYKGGRCSGLALMGSNLLHLKPCIEMQGGTLSPAKKYRGNLEKCLDHYVSDRFEHLDSICPDFIFITHTLIGKDRAIAEEIRQRVEDLHYFKEVLLTDAGSIISCHCGPGTLGMLYTLK